MKKYVITEVDRTEWMGVLRKINDMLMTTPGGKSTRVYDMLNKLRSLPTLDEGYTVEQFNKMHDAHIECTDELRSENTRLREGEPCHKCGEPSRTNEEAPLCQKCWSKDYGELRTELEEWKRAASGLPFDRILAVEIRSPFGNEIFRLGGIMLKDQIAPILALLDSPLQTETCPVCVGKMTVPDVVEGGVVVMIPCPECTEREKPGDFQPYSVTPDGGSKQ